MKASILAAAALLTWNASAAAQCCGDGDGNGVVTIDEVIGAVNRGLGLLECQGASAVV